MVRLSGIPAPLAPTDATRWEVSDERLAAKAPARSDLFISPFGNPPVLNAPMLLFPASGDFLLSARVTVGFGARFDAGVLVVFEDDRHWAKLCLEYSPQRRPMVVSVVTREVSDDCNSEVINDGSVFLRIGRRGAGYVFHASEDRRVWRFVRAFTLGGGEVKAGFLVQSPTGDGCNVEFSEISFEARTLGDYRSGE